MESLFLASHCFNTINKDKVTVISAFMAVCTLKSFFKRNLHLLAAYQKEDLPKITHGPEVHEVILITAMRDYNLRPNPT